MSPVLRPRSHSLPPNFAQWIAQKFGRGPFLVIGAEQDELVRQFKAAEISATVTGAIAEVPPALRAGLAIWFYSRDNAGDERAVQALAAAAENVLLVPEPGTETAVRRPELVRRFAEAGLLPDYDCDLGTLEPGALRLVRGIP